MKRILYLIPLLMLLAGCQSDEPTPVAAPLVVEGWIENGEKPVVMVTRAADMSADVVCVDSLVQRWCRVRLSDGERSEILLGHLTSDYLTRLVYTSSNILGKTGVTYTLSVETDDETVVATATIPPTVAIDSLRIVPVEGTDSLFTIKAFIRADAAKARYYKFFTKTDSETRYYSSFLGTFSIDDYDPKKGWTVAKGIHGTYADTFTPHYRHGESVLIKLCTLEAPLYDFWMAYENAVSLQGNAFFAVTQGCPGNVEGALGYWGAYGVAIARVRIP